MIVHISDDFLLGDMIVGLGRGGRGVGHVGNLGKTHVIVVAQVEGQLLLVGQREDGTLQSDGFGVAVVNIAVGCTLVEQRQPDRRGQKAILLSAETSCCFRWPMMRSASRVAILYIHADSEWLSS